MVDRPVTVLRSGGMRPPKRAVQPAVTKGGGAGAGGAGGAGKKEDGRVVEMREVEDLLWQLGTDAHGWTAAETTNKDGIQLYHCESKSINMPRSRSKSPPNSDNGSIGKLNKPSPNSAPPMSSTHKVWKCLAQLPAHAKDVYKLLSDASDIPTWNKTIVSYKVLENIDPLTDIVQCVTAPTGLVSARDFVTLRRRSHRSTSDAYVITCLGTESKFAKQWPETVRGSQGPGGFIIRSLPTSPNMPPKCSICWVLNTDLRGWIPKSIIDANISSVLKDWARALRTQLKC